MATHTKLLGLFGTLAAVTFAGAGTARASVFESQSGWFWADPVPQGNTLRTLAVSGPRIYAAGDFGTLLRSDDGGTTWRGLTTGTNTPLTVVRTLPPDTVVAGGTCVVLRSDDGGQSFRRLRWAPPGAACRTPLRSLALPSAQLAYVVLVNGTVLRSTDGGKSWSVRTAIPGTKAANRNAAVSPTDLYFTSGDTGFVATDAGVLYRTTDGGASWSPVAAAGQPLDSVDFGDASTGYAVGGSALLKTTDGGLSWELAPNPPGASADWIRCADALRCVAVATAGDQLWRSDDGGLSWTSVSPASRPLLAAGFSTSGSLVAVGDGGTTVASDDGGQNFATISGNLGGVFTRVRASSALVAYALGADGALARTTDGGEDWVALTPPFAGDLLDVSFPTSATGFALGTDGTLVRTDDAGQSWQLLDTGTYLAPNALVALSPDHIILVGPRGVRGSLNGGLDFVRVRQRGVADATLSSAGHLGMFFFAFGPHALVTSKDGGSSWRALRLPGANEQLVSVNFVATRVAYALTDDGRAWQTTDAGRTWGELPALGTEVGSDLSFSDPGDGYVTVSDFGGDQSGYVMRTSDAGRTWHPQLVDSQRLLPGSLAAPTTHTAYAITRLGHLLATHSGGDTGAPSALTLTINRKRPGKQGIITINGRLKPARGGETVVISRREGRNSRWRFRAVTVSKSGRFTVFSQVTRTASFVAQWSGDADHVGAGSPVVTVGVGAKYRRRR